MMRAFLALVLTSLPSGMPHATDWERPDGKKELIRACEAARPAPDAPGSPCESLGPVIAWRERDEEILIAITQSLIAAV
jgi:hypothetical protein